MLYYMEVFNQRKFIDFGKYVGLDFDVLDCEGTVDPDPSMIYQLLVIKCKSWSDTCQKG